MEKRKGDDQELTALWNQLADDKPELQTDESNSFNHYGQSSRAAFPKVWKNGVHGSRPNPMPRTTGPHVRRRDQNHRNENVQKEERRPQVNNRHMNYNMRSSRKVHNDNKIEPTGATLPKNNETRSQQSRNINFKGNIPGKVQKIEKSDFEDRATLHAKRETFPMGFKKLDELIYKKSNEIMCIILNKDNGFFLNFEKKDINRNMMAKILIVLEKALSSRMRKNISHMINTVTSSKYMFFKSLSSYLASFQKFSNNNEKFHLESLVSLCEFLLQFQAILPSTASDPLIELLPLLEKTCKLYLTDSDKYLSVLKILEELDEQNRHFLRGYSQTEIKQASRKEKLQLQNPPESYRSIPVLPSMEDIHQSCSFLRPNLVKGQYQDAEHYLDVQYRLLREDYVKPLRDGIAEFVYLKKQGKSFKHCKDVRIYSDVHIIKQDFVNGGLVHIAHFNDANFSKIRWEYSKRFLTGSLLCLSSDEFQTMLFATVARRDPKELTKGLLLLRFEELTDEVLNLSPLRNFVVVETTAYFEAYRHNLSAILDLNEETLPMKPYIVEVKKDVYKPQYLRTGVTYDMRPLLIPLESKYIKHFEDEDGHINTSYDFPQNMAVRSKSIAILENDQWPSSSELNLDTSQYTAIKAAVTKEFAVIQGPPGTGKTYVGLRIAQLLLHNQDKWQSQADPTPILVVCYTNHALDQFLEGLSLFTQRIVRVGGRGTNEALAKYQLNNLKRIIEQKRQVPINLFKIIKKKNYELKMLKESIDVARKSVEKCYSVVLSEEILKPCMDVLHYTYLKNMHTTNEDDKFKMHVWLGTREHAFVQVGSNDPFFESEVIPSTSLKQNTILTSNTAAEVDDVEDSEGEADIEYIEAQRDIDAEEFADVSFEVNFHEPEEIFVPVPESGWQVQGGFKKRIKYILNNIRNAIALSEVEAKSVNDIWSLSIDLRWRLYRFWLESYIESKQIEIFNMQQQLRKEFEELCEMRSEEDLLVCQQAHVVGMTTTGAAKYRNIVQHLNPRIVIVEEAAEILESHIVTSLAPNTQHLILIGDHQQLKPSPAVYSLAVRYDLNVSLFERMVKNGMECFRLNIQHRMRPEIASLIAPHIYEDLRNHESVAEFENIKGVNKNVFFITHNFNELQEFDTKSKVNEHEARFLVKLCRYFLLQGYDPSQLTVLTTYSGQLFALKKLIGVGGLLQGVKITVVDNYQGEENDIILISFVRSNEEGDIGFLKVSNRVCVALSRAKKGLFCIGNFELLEEKCDLWKNILSTLQKNQNLGPCLQLMCQNHPGVSNVVASEADFDSVPEGGCTRSCEFRLSCGHVCSLMCHPYDKEHENINCLKACGKKCGEGHPCKRKCHEPCGNCTVMVDKKIQSCGHTIKVKCHLKHKNTVCTKPCERRLQCGHFCSKTCNSACAVKCTQTVQIVSPLCKHMVETECFNSSNEEYLIKKCSSFCTVELSCGHACKGRCRSCYQGRLHVACNQPCKRILVCGHECKSPCSKSCPPCRLPCENRCVHSKCPKKCGEPCEKCTEPCAWSCPHEECERLCGEPCSRTACNEPCPETLQCKHPCIGLCGEPCPKECRVCDEDTVKEIFFGSEDDEDARFICLEDCKHIIEVEGLTQWMNQTKDKEQEIQMKCCPKCKKVIRRNLRFGNIVKSCLSDIEKVKNVTYGEKQQNLMKQANLLHVLESKDNSVSKILKPLLPILKSNKVRSIQEITIVENIINIADALGIATNVINFQVQLVGYFSDSIIEASYNRLVCYIHSTKMLLEDFIQDEYLTASEQQLQELNWEVHRLKLARKLLDFMFKSSGRKMNSSLSNLLQCIITRAPFHEEELNMFTSEFKKLLELTGGAEINVSELEKQTILKAMGLSQGHWYQCPNGHVYCITECGGAMQESHCNECGAKIGGTNHSLLSGNRVATAMDGSRYGAWSDQMNMENYQF